LWVNVADLTGSMAAVCIFYLLRVAAQARLKGIGTRLAGSAWGALGSLRAGTAACFPRSLRRGCVDFTLILVRDLFQVNFSAKESKNSLMGALLAPRALLTASSKSPGSPSRKLLSYPPLRGSFFTNSTGASRNGRNIARLCSTRHWGLPCLIASSAICSEL
jgi:hypothetical protein